MKDLFPVRWLLAGIIAAGALGPSAAARASSAVAQPQPPAGLRILESSASEIRVELTVGAFVTDTLSIDGVAYQRLTLPGFEQSTQAGAPQVPVRGALLGIPTPDGAQVTLEAQDVESVMGLRLAPAPTLAPATQGLDSAPDTSAVTETWALDPRAYAANSFYPGPLVALGQVGYFRDQAVAHVQFNPVQYNPVTGETRIAHRLVARLTWSATASTAPASSRAASPQFENVLQQSILNYGSLARPSLARAADLPGQANNPQLAATGTVTPALKISIASSGIYTLSYAAITAAGFNLAGVDPRTIKIKHRGAEVPIQVIGEADGVFNLQDYVLFYGAAYDDVYTNVDVYWLEAGGANGLRMALPSGAPAGAPIPQDFPVHLHAEVDQNYWSNMLNGAGQDHWFWGTRLSPPGGGLASYRDYSDTMAYPPLGCNCLTLHNLATGPVTATVKVRLRGYTFPHHHTQIFLNGNLIADQGWDGRGQLDLTSVVAQNLLVNGGNTVRVQAISDGASNGVDQILVDWIEIDYRDRYIAANNSLQFVPPHAGTWQYSVSGFSQPAIEAFDITNPDAPTLISSAVVSGAGPYAVTFQAASAAASTYLALTPDQYKPPAAIALDQPSNWHATSNQADWIIITHRDFYTEAVALANLRQSQGLRVAVVDVQDLYDEFNDGIFNPQAIRDFLAYAFANWKQPAPTYVVLLGDACQDFKNALWDNPNNSCQDFVPAPIYESNLSGQVPSDDWYVDFHGNDLFPDMFIGRISVQTPQQAHDAVAKIIQYDQSPPAPAWSHTVTFIAGGDDTIFSQYSDQVSNTVSAGYTVNRLYFGPNPPNPTGDIETVFANGSLLVNYFGHGEFLRWGTYDGSVIYLKTNQIADFTNVGRLAIVTIGDCLNGDFSGPTASTSLAEYFQRAPSVGAVAVFAPADLGYPTWHRDLMVAFYQAIFTGHLNALGAAVTSAKINLLSQNSGLAGFVQTYELFGDPATTLGRSVASTPTVYLPLIRR